MRICVIRNKNNEISCIPVTCSKQYYYNKFEVLCFVNETWDLYYINIIKRYFQRKGFVEKYDL